MSTHPPSLPPFPSKPYTPTHTTWPYTPLDFTRHDSSPDTLFYLTPRFVTHIDAPAARRLTAYYASVLPCRGAILDLCASWTCFYPTHINQGVKNGDINVYGIGLNAAELGANTAFRGPGYWRVLDLNAPPYDVRGAAWSAQGDVRFDAITCAVSIDYLTHPLEVCSSLLGAAKAGAALHVVVSNRCFGAKVVRRWMELDEVGRLEFVGDYLHFAGWSDVEIVDLCARDGEGRRVTDERGTVVVGDEGLPGHLDPLWVVRGRKRVEGAEKGGDVGAAGLG
ncbi:hypothetical protein IQ07DRAFT_577993 [Pyrenochaeta sp. DS3sAY3a]|nr:hypothetical protein IQ07DRAFT_577993 [Pyrenochaeta sp. DS3sAY3a]